MIRKKNVSSNKQLTLNTAANYPIYELMYLHNIFFLLILGWGVTVSYTYIAPVIK